MTLYCFNTPIQPKPPKFVDRAPPDGEAPTCIPDTSTIAKSPDTTSDGEIVVDPPDDLPPQPCPPAHTHTQAYATADDSNQTPDPTPLSDAILSLIQANSSSDLAATAITIQAMACLSFCCCPDYPQKGQDFLLAWTVISVVAVTACLVVATLVTWLLLIEKGIPSLLRSLRQIVTQILESQAKSQSRLEKVLLCVIFCAGVLLMLPLI